MAPLGFVPRYLRTEGDDRRGLAQPDVLGMDGQALPTRNPVRSMMRMAIRTGKLGAAATSAAASVSVK